jgi:hypothetical protein
VAGAQAAPPPRSAPPERYSCADSPFPIVDDRVWAYYTAHGGLSAFGCTISRLFLFEGLPAQFFERRIVQLDEQGNPRLLNVLDPEFLPDTQINNVTYPPVDQSMKLSTPSVTSDTYVPDLLQIIMQNVPEPFHTTYFSLVSPQIAGSNDPNVVAMANVELWGAPISPPTPAADHPGVIYQRFQRQIMIYDPTCSCVSTPVLARYLKDIIMGNPLPADLQAAVQSRPLYRQYAPDQPRAVRDPALLPSTDLSTAFLPE